MTDNQNPQQVEVELLQKELADLKSTIAQDGMSIRDIISDEVSDRDWQEIAHRNLPELGRQLQVLDVVPEIEDPEHEYRVTVVWTEIRRYDGYVTVTATDGESAADMAVELVEENGRDDITAIDPRGDLDVTDVEAVEVDQR